MLTIGVIFALVSVASAGYASSSSGASSGGLYGDNAYQSTYSSNYPYTNSYAGYAGAVPVGPFVNPYSFQSSFAEYYNAISDFNRKHLTTSYAGDGSSVSAYASLSPPRHKHYENEYLKNLFNQQLAYQQAIQNSIQANLNALNQAAYGGGYAYQPGGGIHNRFGGSSGNGFASGGAYAGTSGGGVTGSYGGINPGGHVYGGTSGGGRPVYSTANRFGGSTGGGNYASAGGSVSSNGHTQQHAAIYPANPARPNLDSRFGGDDATVGVSHSAGPGGPGFVGVSSFSSSSDINGVKNRESGTSVNKNGQVTTYYTRN